MNLQTIDDVYELMGAHLNSAVLNAALKLGLFWRIADGPQPLDSLSQEIGIPPVRCRYWLKLLVNLGLLDQRDDLFSLTPVARRTILDTHSQVTWKMLATDALDDYEDGVSLAKHLLAASPGNQRQQRPADHLPAYVQKMAEDPERARLFTRMLFELHIPLAQAVADALELDGARRLLDVGGGSGVVSLALLHRAPELTAVVVDIPNVCAAAREIADRLPECERIFYWPLDFVRDALPGAFDIVLECDVGQFDDGFLSRLATSVNEGGRLVIVDRWFDMNEEASPDRLGYLLRKSLADPEFSLKSLEETRAALARVGLEVESVTELPYKKWKLIEARKRAVF